MLSICNHTMIIYLIFFSLFCVCSVFVFFFICFRFASFVCVFVVFFFFFFFFFWGGVCVCMLFFVVAFVWTKPGCVCEMYFFFQGLLPNDSRQYYWINTYDGLKDKVRRVSKYQCHISCSYHRFSFYV